METKPDSVIPAESATPEIPQPEAAKEPSQERMKEHLQGQLDALLGSDWEPDPDANNERVKKMNAAMRYYDTSEKMGWRDLAQVLRFEPDQTRQIMDRFDVWYRNLMDDRQMIRDYILERPIQPQNPKRFLE